MAKGQAGYRSGRRNYFQQENKTNPSMVTINGPGRRITNNQGLLSRVFKQVSVSKKILMLTHAGNAYPSGFLRSRIYDSFFKRDQLKLIYAAVHNEYLTKLRQKKIFSKFPMNRLWTIADRSV